MFAELMGIYTKENSKFASRCVATFILECNALSDFHMQVITGHEAVGTIVAMGSSVQGFSLGDRIVADVSVAVRVPPLCIFFYTYSPISSSATHASTAVVVKNSYAKTTTRRV